MRRSNWLTIALLISCIMALGLGPEPLRVFVVFLAAPFWALCHAVQRTLYWLLSFALVAIGYLLGGPPFGLILLGLSVLVGAFIELKAHKASVLMAGFLSCAIASGVVSLFTGLWIKISGIRLLEVTRQQLALVVEQIAKANPKIVLSEDLLVQQIPSGMVILILFTLAIALKGGPRVLSWVEGQGYQRSQKFEFALPSSLVWFTLASILGSSLFVDHYILQTISINALNVFIVLYFFQGVSIIACFFHVFRIGPIWQWMWYLLLFIQFFIVISLIGFSDYWVGYRERFVKRAEKSSKPV